jgi:NAD+-dependent secondary alcohol dehydrogenase Adh1
MKAAVLHGYNENLGGNEFVRYEDAPDPRITHPTDVIVRIGGAGVCRTDLHAIQGLWRPYYPNAKLPHILGHENAGWVEEVGSAVQSVKVGDAVICHPITSDGYCLACRRGEDQHAEGSRFPGLSTNGGYAEYLLTGERALIKLPKTLAPKDVAAFADAGLTAYHAAKRASRTLLPGDYAVVIGVGGLGHIGIQVLAALCAAEIIAIDQADIPLQLAKECGAHHVVKADGTEVKQVLELTNGHGAEAVLDFVAEGDTIANGFAMTRDAGAYHVVGYGGQINLPAMAMITSEKSIVGDLVGTWPDLWELMALADRGRVHLATQEYRLADANQALLDLRDGKIKGRAVLIP